MGRKWLPMFDPSIDIRIGSIVIGASILVGVITATVDGFKLTKSLTQSSVVEADMQIVLDRLIAIYELDEYYSANAILQDFITSLNRQFNTSFPESCINLVITAFDKKPVVAGNLQDNSVAPSSGTLSTVTLQANVYFNKNYTADDIRTALINYTQNIDLINRYTGAPSEGLGTIDLGRSVFNGTSPTTLAQPVAQTKQSISISEDEGDDIPPAPPNDTTTPPSLPSQSFVQAYMTITYARALAPDELQIFTDTNSTLQDLTITITNQIESTFWNSFVTLNILLFSHEPILISNTTTSGTNNTIVLIEIFASVFYLQNQRSATISNAFTGSTQPIILLDQNNLPSSATANFSSKYSIFTDTFSPDLTPQQITDLTAISQNKSWTPPTSTTTDTTTFSSTSKISITTSTTTTNTAITLPRCQLYTQAYMSINLRVSVSGGTTAFDDVATTIQGISVGINGTLSQYFGQSFLQFDMLMLSNGAIPIAGTNNRRRKRQNDGTGIIIIFGIAYFDQNETSEDIINALTNYQLVVTLNDGSDQGRSTISYFVRDYSIFEDTSPVDSNQDETTEVAPGC